MSERIFRLILGVSLLLFLLMQWQMAIYGYIVLLMFEGVTNWRIPILVSKLRYGDKFQEYVEDSSSDAKVQFDAERVLRFVVGIFVVISFILLQQTSIRNCWITWCSSYDGNIGSFL